MSRITATTNVCAIFGHPVAHSMSPAIHNAAFEAKGLNLAYVAHDVKPDVLAAAMNGVRAMGYRGLSVTIPHKVAALELVDAVDETAARIGCINTVVNDDGTLKGYNTDGLGALQALRAAGADPRGKRVVILGSGGAARAIVMTMALQAAPAKISILGIVESEREQLARDVDGCGTTQVTTDNSSDSVIEAELASADIVVQSTPIGMHPKTEASLVPARHLRPELTVFDAIYNPRRTKLLRESATAGCTVVEGLEMFLRQAVAQFELWTGEPAPVEVMRKIVEERL